MPSPPSPCSEFEAGFQPCFDASDDVSESLQEDGGYFVVPGEQRGCRERVIQTAHIAPLRAGYWMDNVGVRTETSQFLTPLIGPREELRAPPVPTWSARQQYLQGTFPSPRVFFPSFLLSVAHSRLEHTNECQFRHPNTPATTASDHDQSCYSKSLVPRPQL